MDNIINIPCIDKEIAELMAISDRLTHEEPKRVLNGFKISKLDFNKYNSCTTDWATIDCLYIPDDIIKKLEPIKVVNKGNNSNVYYQRISKNEEWQHNMKCYRELLFVFFKEETRKDNLEYFNQFGHLLDDMDKKEQLFKIYNRKWNKLICDEINKESYANGHYSL